MDIKEIAELKEVKSLAKAQELIDEGWTLLETGVDEVYKESKDSDTIPLFNKLSTFRFVLGRIKPPTKEALKAVDDMVKEAKEKGWV